MAAGLAAGLLTCLPLPKGLWFGGITADDQRRSVLWYPWVGALVGLGLTGFALVLPAHWHPLLTAAAIVTGWTLITGALHLDGLADCWDGAFAAHGDGTRALAVMRDPAIGAAGAVALILALLGKAVLVMQLALDWQLWPALLVAAVGARALAVGYLTTTAYAREGGIATPLQDARPWPARLSALLAVALLLCVAPVAHWLALVIVWALLLGWWRRRWQRVIGGYTGDCLGALIELAELATLLLWAVMPGARHGA